MINGSSFMRKLLVRGKFPKNNDERRKIHLASLMMQQHSLLFLRSFSASVSWIWIKTRGNKWFFSFIKKKYMRERCMNSNLYADRRNRTNLIMVDKPWCMVGHWHPTKYKNLDSPLEFWIMIATGYHHKDIML